MKLIAKVMVVPGFLCVLLPPFIWSQAPPPAKAPPQVVWSPKSIKLTGWVAPNRPHWKLSEILAKHKGQANWQQVVVSDDHLHAAYIQMAAGQKTPRRMHPDTREWWVIQDGQIRFTIDGQDPFVASKGYLVQVPYRTFYSMETEGDKPSLRFEVNIAGAKTQYPVDEKPPLLPGFTFVKTTVTGRGKYENGNRPFIDFNAVVAGTETQRRFIADDRAVSNIIFGDASKQRPVTDAEKGHFHPECAEFWFILLGRMEYKLEGAGMILADQGDIVYAPRMHWHRPRFGGDGPACRLAMNGYQDIAHMFEATDSNGGR
ncbi:MAG TPA: cupin domain-containing protein [Bryobacteraceae bacterium]|nr:cupin domain-containing protein [Bryobacteraceae bacterium]